MTRIERPLPGDEFDHALAAQVGRVQRTLPVDADPVGRVGFAGPGGIAAEQFAGFVQERDAARPVIGHERPFPAHEQAVGSAALLPLGDEFSLRGEYLHAVVLAIADAHAARGVQADGVRQIELPAAVPLRPQA